MNVSPTDSHKKYQVSVLSVYLDQDQDPIIIESPHWVRLTQSPVQVPLCLYLALSIWL